MKINQIKILSLGFLLFVAILKISAGKYSINDAWYFSKQNCDKQFEANVNWEKVNIPHTWNSEDALRVKNYYKGDAWYKKEFSLNAKSKDKTIFLQFEGVLSYSEIYLNNKLIGVHKGGYSAFQFDITDNVFFEKPNKLLVKVNNENKDIPPLMGDFTFWGGIYRDVNIITVSKIHFKPNEFGGKGIYIQTPQVNNDLASLKTTVDCENKTLQNQKLEIQCLVRNPKNEVVARQNIKLNLKPEAATKIVFEKLTVNAPQLWSPDEPNLYSVEINLVDAKTKSVYDSSVSNVGLRWFSVDPEKGFFLNGKHLKLIGVNRHQDFEGLGSALTDDFHFRDMQLIKDMGANFIRVAHYPQDENVLDACDKLGLIAWEEIPIIESVLLDNEFTKTCERNFKEMVYQHYNHPSVVMWGLMNESVWGSIRLYSETERQPYIERTHLIAQKLDSISKAIDPRRLTTIAHHGDRDAYHKAGLCNVTDLVGWNVYNGWYGGDTKGFAETVDEEHAIFPTQKMIVSEYGAGSDKRLHTQYGQSFDFSIEYQQQYHEAILPYILERDFLAATAVWNMFDFGSANRDESMPRVNNKGLCYYNRTPKDVYYYYQAMLSDKKMVHIATRDWLTLTETSDSDTLIYPVKVYSNAAEVELFVNGKSFGKKSPENRNTLWKAPFVDGKNTLVAKTADGAEDATVVNCNIIPTKLSNLKNNLFSIGINCGSNCSFSDDKSGFTWLADRVYTPGSFGYMGGKCYRPNEYKIGITDQVDGTRNVPLFQTFRVQASAYRFDVPNGEYEVELAFNEPRQGQNEIPEDNCNTIVLNGTKVIIPALNIASSCGRLFALTHKLKIEVTDSKGINVAFENLKGLSMISAIRLTKLR